MSSTSNGADDIEHWLLDRGVCDIETVYTAGYAMWAQDPPYEFDIDSWQRMQPPVRTASAREQCLIELGYDFLGLMKVSRYFIGQTVAHRPVQEYLDIESSVFDYYVFASLTSMVSAQDRLRDLFIVAALGEKTDEIDQLDRGYALAEKLGCKHSGAMRDAARAAARLLRERRNDAIHAVATRRALIERMLLERERYAFENQVAEVVDAADYAEALRHAEGERAKEMLALDETLAQWSEAYSLLVRVGDLTFRTEHELRARPSAASSDHA